tara:strand:- start:57 stop:428 length:372 start_codon:yes stop_codon:yes gene_type:complete
MNNTIKEILSCVGIQFEPLENNTDILIQREILINDEKYIEVKDKIQDLKKFFSSSFLTSLQKDASENQKWPLLNLVRQLLKASLYNMKPIRKANGYTKEGKKLYKRFFLISKLKIKEVELKKE